MSVRRLRRSAVALGVVAVCVLAAGCGSSAGTSASTTSGGTRSAGPKPSIVAISGATSDSFFSAVSQGMNDAATQLDVDLRILTLNNYDNFVPDIVKNYQTAMALNPGGVAAWNLVPDSFGRHVRALIAKGVPVVEYNGVDERDRALAYVVTDDYKAGVQAGDAMVAAGKKTGMCVTYKAGTPKFADRCRGYRDALTKAGGSSTVVVIPGKDQNNPAKMAQDIQGALSSHPDVDAVFTITTPPAHGALTATKNLGRDGDVAVGTVDLDAQILADVAGRRMAFAIDEEPYLQGYYAIQLLAQYIRFGFAPAAPVVTGPRLIDAANVRTALRVIREHPGILGGA